MISVYFPFLRETRIETEVVFLNDSTRSSEERVDTFSVIGSVSTCFSGSGLDLHLLDSGDDFELRD